MTIDELRSKTTIDVPQAGEVLGLSRSNAYAAARAGTIPTLRLGHRLVVPVPALLRLLGDARTPELDAAERPASDD